MTAEIEEGIFHRKCIEIHYDPGWRLVEPHALGRCSKGNLLLRAYQVEGASASGEPDEWKLFRIDRVTALRISDQSFDGPRPLYNPNDKAMKGGIIARL